jgi:acetate kinase
MMKNQGWSPDEVSNILCRESGLKGISGISGDVRDLEEAAEKGNPRGALALEVFVYQVQKQIGAMAVATGGMDALVFTGGIGERGISIRASICQGLGFLGVALDEKKNRDCFGKEAVISPVRSPVTVAVIPTNEELVVARETSRLLDKG